MTQKIAVVTGGSAGIGLATAQRLARAGWAVAIVARDAERLEEAASLLRREGGAVLAISADVADAHAIDGAAERIERELGPISAWINNAMSTVVAPADEISAAEYARVTATTYLGQVHGTLAALRYMKPRRRGTIVQISSVLGFRGVPLQAAYCAAKFAVSGFTDALRAELIADDLPIALSVVYLPAVNTPQFGWARNHSGRQQRAPAPIFDPRVCAEGIARAVAHPTREVWIGRGTPIMSLGQKLLPSFSDHKASAFKADQQGTPQAPRDGNLDEAVPGPATIDGPWQADISSPVGQIFTTRHRTGAMLALAGLGLGLAGSIVFGLRGSRA